MCCFTRKLELVSNILWLLVEIFTRAFLLKIIIRTWNGFFKCFKVLSLKMKKESSKRCEPPIKYQKFFTQQEIQERNWKGEKWRNKSIRKV